MVRNIVRNIYHDWKHVRIFKNKAPIDLSMIKSDFVQHQNMFKDFKTADKKVSNANFNNIIHPYVGPLDHYILNIVISILCVGPRDQNGACFEIRHLLSNLGFVI